MTHIPRICLAAADREACGGLASWEEKTRGGSPAGGLTGERDACCDDDAVRPGGRCRDMSWRAIVRVGGTAQGRPLAATIAAVWASVSRLPRSGAQGPGHRGQDRHFSR
jgi:hypothetical protein